MIRHHGAPSQAKTPSLRPNRFILIGASNLTRGISTVVGCARSAAGSGPLEVFCALGHGRSYGLRSRIIARSIPGIVDSALWHDLRAAERHQPAARTRALVTDVGNDVAYGVEPERIAEWLRFTLHELRERGARTIITPLPLPALERFSPTRFELARRLLFPSRSLTLDDVLRRARETDRHLRALAAGYGAVLVEPDPAWYGLDAIHLRLRAWSQAWPTILAPWLDNPACRAAFTQHHPRADLRRWLSIRLSAPSHWWLFGVAQRRQQPSVRLADGTLLWLH